MAKTNKQWEIEDAARTLIRAEEIKRDKKLFNLVLKEIQKQQQATVDVLGMSGSDMKDD